VLHVQSEILLHEDHPGRARLRRQARRSPTAFVVDYDDAGRIVGVEILDASKRTDDPEVLKHYSFDVPAAG
jgi:uncharacterized protein YuzE